MSTMEDGNGARITGITVGSVLLILVVGAWGYVYRLDTSMEASLEAMRREMRAETVRQDTITDTAEVQLRKEFYEQLGFLRQEMLRLDQRDDEQANKIMARLEQLTEQVGTLRGDLKVLFSEKARH